MKKLKILLYWFEMDHRPELLQPFLELSSHFEFIHVYYRKPAERTTSSSPFKMIYWFDYKSPYHLLNEIKPQRVIVPDANDLLSISMVIACRMKNIPTFSLQHGYVITDVVNMLSDIKRTAFFSKLSTYIKLFGFYIRSLKFKNLYLFPQLIKFLFSYYKYGGIKGLYRRKYSWRMIDYYLCYSAGSAKYFHERDNIDEYRIKITGVITFDELYQVLNDVDIPQANEKYYLLVDTNFTEHKNPVSIDQILRNYRELAIYCEKRNAKLKVKLHPWCYKNEYEKLLDLDNVEFFRNISQKELAILIKNSEGCFGFYSTLSFPIIAYKHFCHIKCGNIVMQDLESKNIAQVIDFFSFTNEEILMDKYQCNEKNKEEYIKYYLGYIDGNSVSRLHNFLSE